MLKPVAARFKSKVRLSNWTSNKPHLSRMAAAGDKNRGPEIIAIFCSLTTIAAITVALRLWTRSQIVRKVGADDWLMAVALVSGNSCKCSPG